MALGAGPKVNGNALVVRPQDFGAKVDGTSLDSPAVNAAIDRANGQGGGVVYLSPGVYLCGTVVLKSNVTLYLEAGAVLLGSKDVKQYAPQSGPPENADASTRHLIFAKDAENITLCGPGLIDGQGPSFWVPSGRRIPAPEDQWGDVASLYLNPKPRVSPMLEFVNCRRLHVEQVRIENASGWTMRLMSCWASLSTEYRSRILLSVQTQTGSISLTPATCASRTVPSTPVTMLSASRARTHTATPFRSCVTSR